MSVHERSLSIMAVEVVNEVIIGAPAHLTDDLLKTFNISLVVRGTVSETAGFVEHDASRYSRAKALGVFKCALLASNRACLRSLAGAARMCGACRDAGCGMRRQLPSPSSMTTKTIIQRIIVNRKAYEDRQKKKVKSEAAYYAGAKAYVDER